MISGNSATNPPVLIVFGLENYRYSITKGTYHLSELTSCQLPVKLIRTFQLLIRRLLIKTGSGGRVLISVLLSRR